MKFEKVNVNGFFQVDEKFISIRDDNKLLFLSEKNFEIVKEYDLSNFIFALHFYEKKIVLSNLKDKHLEIIPKDLLVIEHNNLCYPISNFDANLVYYCPQSKLFNLNKTDNVVNRNFQLETKVFENLIIECNILQKSQTFVRAIDLTNNKIKWQKDFSETIARVEQINNFLIMDYNSQVTKTIVLDILTGQEIWRLPYTYSKIDRNNEVLLSSINSNIVEIELNTGSIKTEISVDINNCFGCYPHFVDKEGIYYTNHKGSFGKINRDTGLVLWEFDLIDEEGNKRKLSTWHLLKNGNLVLQAMPNHPNGDLTCILNPEENMQYSKIYPA